MVRYAVVAPLSKGSQVFGDSTRIEQAELLKHDAVVPREVTRIGVCGAVRVGARQLHHPSERYFRRWSVASRRKPRAFLFYGLHERVTAELELTAEWRQLRPEAAHVTGFARLSGLLRESRYRARRAR